MQMTTDLRVIKTIRDIQEGFIQVLQDKSFEKITVNDICTASLVGRSTFYHHYQDKYDLLEQMNHTQANNFKALLSNRVQQLQQDELLLDLYNGLVPDRKIITTLMTITDVKDNLKAAYFKILKQYFDKVASQIRIDVPNDFLSDFYANSALTAILWSLEHGQQEKIATFMNSLVKKSIG